MEDLLTAIDNYSLKTTRTSPTQLAIPKPIIKRRRKYKELKNRSRFYYFLEQGWQAIFPIQYNLYVYPAVQFEEEFFVFIEVNKTDNEYGYQYFFCFDEHKKLIDWCEIFWEQ